MKAQQMFETVTAEMIAAIEAGAGEWRMPWHTLAEAGTPENADGRRYRGMNALWLPIIAASRGWDSGVWATYPAWQRHGAQVRRGEKGSPVIVWKQHAQCQTTPAYTPVEEVATEPDDDDTYDPVRRRWYVRGYTVFAAEQVDGAESILAARAASARGDDGPERVAAAEAYFAGLGSTVSEHGNRAFYSPVTDSIVVPPLAQFDDAEHYYATLAHEHVHWTGHRDRCNRDLSVRFASHAYAAEELTAELGAAMWCAQAGIAPATRQDHAAYLAHWLEILQADARHLATVASKAQIAVDWLNTHTTAPLPAHDTTS